MQVPAGIYSGGNPTNHFTTYDAFFELENHPKENSYARTTKFLLHTLQEVTSN